MLKNLILVLASTQAHRLNHHHYNLVQSQGIDSGDLMSGRHWKKSWPEGFDDSTDDDSIINLGHDALGRTKKPPVQKVTYEFKLDEDILDSQRHLKKTEETREQEFGVEGYQDRGRAIINSSSDKAIKGKVL